MAISRRQFVAGLGAVSGTVAVSSRFGTGGSTASPATPGPEVWQQLRDQVGDRLITVESPLRSCLTTPPGPDCTAVLENL